LNSSISAAGFIVNRSFVSLALIQNQILGKSLVPLPIMHCFSLVVVVKVYNQTH